MVAEQLVSIEASNRALIKDVYDAAAAGDVGPLFALMANDFVATEDPSLPWGGTYRGLARNQELVAVLARYLDFSTLSMHHYLVDRELVIAYGSVRRQVDGVKVPLAEVWEVRDGRAVSLRPFIWDTSSFVRQPEDIEGDDDR
jgi:ketosteroid isomerase-like protein